MRAIFRGLEGNMALLEYEVYEADGDGTRHFTTKILRQPVQGKSHSCNFGFGYQPGARWMYPVIPEIGQEVEYETEIPDMAGHLVAWIGPVEKKVEEVA